MTDVKILEARYRKSKKPIDLSRWLNALHQKGKCARVVLLFTEEGIAVDDAQGTLPYLYARCLFDIQRFKESEIVVGHILRNRPDHGRALELNYKLAIIHQRTLQARECLEQLEFMGWDLDQLLAWKVQYERSATSAHDRISRYLGQDTVPAPVHKPGSDPISLVNPENGKARKIPSLKAWLLKNLDGRSWDDLKTEALPLLQWFTDKETDEPRTNRDDPFECLIQKEGHDGI